MIWDTLYPRQGLSSLLTRQITFSWSLWTAVTGDPKWHINNRNVFLTILKDRKSKIKAPEARHLGEPTSCL